MKFLVSYISSHGRKSEPANMRQMSEVTKLSSNIQRKHAESKDVEEKKKGQRKKRNY